MSDTIIRVENLSKHYNIGKSKPLSLRESISEKFKFSKGEDKGKSNDFWALNDISFDIQKGDAVGIIGKNGAGKSTLLKILSRITRPTKGRIEIDGRVASLLEVGTGFHPELTGRENIYLNGTILGMTRSEVKSKFDEIVDFSGVEKFIDTPVKRYSSGMYVRLAFAVAAHLEPEILIIDEVLAVGDAEFQKKCMGKMDDVSKKDGRTIIFVSHNMTAVQSLCSKIIFLKNGTIKYQGDTTNAINSYLRNEINYNKHTYYANSLEDARGNETIKLVKAELYPILNEKSAIDVVTPLEIRFKFYLVESCSLNLSFFLWTLKGDCIFNVVTDSKILSIGYHESILNIPPDLLNDDSYSIELYFVKDRSTVICIESDILSFEVVDLPRDSGWYGKWIGAVRPKLNFKFVS